MRERGTTAEEYGERLLADATLAVSGVQHAMDQLGLRTEDRMTALLIQRAYEHAAELRRLLQSLGEELAAAKTA